MSFDGKLIDNYGYVPFRFFQYFMFILQTTLVYKHKEVNNYLNKFFDPEDKNKQNMKKIILSLPLIAIAYYDIRYSSFSFKNLGIPPSYNDTIKQALNILGSYAIIHIFAQDTGLKTSILQLEYLQTHFLFILISIGMAYSITQNRSQSIIALLLFYHLRYVIGDDKVV